MSVICRSRILWSNDGVPETVPSCGPENSNRHRLIASTRSAGIGQTHAGDPGPRIVISPTLKPHLHRATS